MKFYGIQESTTLFFISLPTPTFVTKIDFDPIESSMRKKLGGFVKIVVYAVI